MPPAASILFKTIDMHTGGEPLRVITQGYPEIAASSLLDYRQQLIEHHDLLRTALMFEPRGDAYVCGIHQFIVQADDRLKYGFLLR